MPISDHSNVTPQQQGNFYRRCQEALDQLRATGHFTSQPGLVKELNFSNLLGGPGA